MIVVEKRGVIRFALLRGKCGWCGTVVRCDERDAQLVPYGGYEVICPTCRHRIETSVVMGPAWRWFWRAVWVVIAAVYVFALVNRTWFL